MKHPFLTLTTILITIALVGAVVVIAINPSNAVSYAEVVESLCLLWVLVGIGYALVEH